MVNIGRLLFEARKAKRLTQKVLAARIGVTAVQLCKIEGGKSKPSFETVEKIAAAVGVSLATLFAEGEKRERAKGNSRRNGELKELEPSRFIGLRTDESELDVAVLKHILTVENEVVALEEMLELPHATLLQLVHSFKVDANGAKTVARYMRSACAVGAATFSDLAELLEFRNVRLHVFDLPEEVQSRSYYDTVNHSLSIVLSKANTPERNVYRIAYELAWVILFGAAGFKPVAASETRHRFAREFASEFLMPEESVRFTVAQLGIKPSGWELETVIWLKSKFNVSAEAFALRLESLGLISERLRQKIRDELHAYYKAHPKAMEPKPALSPLKIGMRQRLLSKAAWQKVRDE